MALGIVVMLAIYGVAARACPGRAVQLIGRSSAVGATVRSSSIFSLPPLCLGATNGNSDGPQGPPAPLRGKGGIIPPSRSASSDAKAEERLRNYPKAKDIKVPLDKVDFAFARSSGPGGQNVNKLNTKAELRFHVDSATWIPTDVRGRLHELQGNKINNSGELLITSQEFRTQSKNKDDCVSKLQAILEEAYVEPKDRKIWTGISKKTKVERRDNKRHRASIKANRKVNKNDW